MRFRTFFYEWVFAFTEWKCEYDQQKAKVRVLRTKRETEFAKM